MSPAEFARHSLPVAKKCQALKKVTVGSSVPTATCFQSILTRMRWTLFALVVVLASLPFFNACTSCSGKERSPEEIRQQTAEATAKLKRDSVAVAQGIKE